ncbi:MAG TPA: glycosyltransferase [Patescibacteria group bacterium]|nr:glycosyltransferase [Patescibacteria group bacterium]
MWALPYGMNAKGLLRHCFTSLIPNKSRYEEFTVHKAIRLPYFWPLINGFLFKYQITNLYKKLEADFIFTEGYTNETEVPCDLPFIYDLADDYAAPADVYGSLVYKFAFKLLNVSGVMERQSKNALAVTAVSEALRKYAKRFNKNVYKSPNGVDNKIIRKVLKDKSTYSKNNFSMIYVTGFGPWSRAIETLKTTVKLHQEFPELSLTLVGKGNQVNDMLEFIKENKAESYIHYLGFVGNREQLFRRINTHSIGLNISDKNKWRDAAHPIKVLEYSALGKRVVSTDLYEVKALRFPNIFLFSDRKGGKSLENTLRLALQDSRDIKDFKNISSHVLKTYNWDTEAKRIIKIVRDMKNSKSVEVGKIVHVTPSYPPNLGGLEKVVQLLARVQKDKGLNVSVITSQPDRKQRLEKDVVQVTRLRSFKFASTKIMPGLLTKILAIKPNDIVHLHIISAYMPEIVWLASKIKGFKYIVHLHLNIEATTRAGWLLKLYKPYILKRVLTGASYIVVFTQEQKNSVFKEYGVDKSKIKVIPNGVEDKFYFDKPRKQHKKPRLLFVGRLDVQKNLPQFLYGLDGISDHFETIIVGDGALKHDLKKLAKELKLKRISFVGRKDGTNLIRYYKSSDIFILPSEREGMPLALLEAMAMGLPSVVTDVSGNHDVIIDGQNGKLVPLGDPLALKNAIKSLSNSRRLYTNMSMSAYQTAHKYSWNVISNQFEKLYENTI